MDMDKIMEKNGLLFFTAVLAKSGCSGFAPEEL